MKKCMYKIKAIIMSFICICSIMIFQNTSNGYLCIQTDNNGKIDINFYDPTTKIIKNENDKIKNIMVQSDGKIPCFIRVKIIFPSKRSYKVTANSTFWQQKADDYWYYNKVLTSKENVTETLTIQVTDNSGKKFNYTVIGETVLAKYNESGPYANW